MRLGFDMGFDLDGYLFAQGRQFRTYKEFSSESGGGIPEGSTYVLRAIVPTNIILTGLELALDNGFIRLRTVAGGAGGGVFAEALPILPRNTMTDVPTPIYQSQINLTAGGTHTGAGTQLDVLRVKVENSIGAASTVGGFQSDERGIGPGTYYFLFTNIGTGVAEGVFHAQWTERG